jgi:hypothetical protein
MACLTKPYLGYCREGRSAKGEDQFEGLVHVPHLARTQSTRMLVEALQVEGAKLLHHHPGALFRNLDLGPKARRQHTARCGRDEDGREPEQLVGLDDDGVAGTALLMPAARG